MTLPPRWTGTLLKLHRWCGLLTALNLIILTVTGALLVFAEELDALTAGEALEVAAEPGPVAPLLQRLVEDHPGYHIGSLGLPHEAGAHHRAVLIADDEEAEVQVLRFELDPGRATVRESVSRGGVVEWLLDLHVHLFLGLPGQILVGVMGLIWVISSGLGVLLYGPFMKRLAVGEVRRAKRAWWADWHKILGAASSAWGVIVGLSGVLLALSFIPIQGYAYSVLQELGPRVADVEGQLSLAEIDRVLTDGAAALPSQLPTSLSWPGGVQGEETFLVLGHAAGPFGDNVLEAAILRADSGEVIETLDLPLILQIIGASGPFHFGSFGGLGVKLLYALFSVVTLGLTVSGAVIWWSRRRRPKRAAEAA